MQHKIGHFEHSFQPISRLCTKKNQT